VHEGWYHVRGKLRRKLRYVMPLSRNRTDLRKCVLFFGLCLDRYPSMQWIRHVFILSYFSNQLPVKSVLHYEHRPVREQDQRHHHCL
jgi:hypothetical protein